MASPFIRLLGAVRFVTDAGEVVELPSPAQRRLVAALALASGATVRTEYLSDALELSSGSLRTTVSRLRARIGEHTIHTDTAGYRITCAVDATMFTDLLVERPDHADRLAALDEALALWHGDALDEFRHEPWAAPEVARLDELRALAVEDRAELLIARARAPEAVASLEALVTANPLRDRPRGLLIQALASSGRQAEALRSYQAYRSFLAEETGTEPSATVRSIERRVAAGMDAPVVAPERARPGAQAGPPFELPLPGDVAEGHALIGRQRETTWLESDLVAARSGSMRTALLGGEAGIGKTTLLAAFARAQHQQAGNVVAFGRCAEGAAVPLEPFRTILTTVVEHAPLVVLQEHCERSGGELLRVAPRLADRLWAPPPVAADAATERYLLFEAAADLLRRVASSGSLTLILDDLHWAEPTALLLLRHLGRALADAPVLLIASYRDTAPDSTADLRSALVDLERGRCRRVTLTGFDDAELTRLLRAVTGAFEDPDTDVLAQLHEETAGNPLYAAQLVRHLWETKQLSIDANEVRFVGDDRGESLPRSLLEVVWSRVHALGRPATEVLRSAAVLGAEFADDAVVSMTELSEPDVVAALDLAVGAGLLGETGDALRPIRFTHALVHQALYSELSPSERRRLHQRAARVLLDRNEHPRPDTVVELARHTELGGDLAAAQHWAVAAATHASEHLAPAEAAAWYERALTFATDRQVPEAERAELMVRLGEAQHHVGDPRTRDTLLEAARLARRTGAHDVLVRAALANDRGFSRAGIADHEQLATLEAAIAVADDADTTSMARLLACRAQELVHTPDHEPRLASAHQAIELVERSSDPTLLPRVTAALVFGLWGPATLSLRRELTQRAVSAAAKVGDPFLEYSTNRAAYYVAIESGDASTAAASLGTIRRIAAEVGEPRLRFSCEVLDGFEATMQARFDDAEAHTQRMFEIGTEIGEDEAFPLYAGQLFANRSFAGRYDEVIPLLEQAIVGTPDSQPFRLAHAISCAVVGREDEARVVLDEAAATRFTNVPVEWMWMTTVIGFAVLAIELEDAAAAAQLYPLLDPFGNQVAFTGATSQGPVSAYLGKLASLLGHHEVADAHLHRALELTRSFGWKYHEATTLLALARSHHRRTGTLDERAATWLDEAATISAERGITIVQTNAARLRASASA